MSFTEKTRRLHNVADIMYHLFQKNRHFCCSSLPAYILCPKPTNNISSQCRQNTDNLRTEDCTNTLEKILSKNWHQSHRTNLLSTFYQNIPHFKSHEQNGASQFLFDWNISTRQAWKNTANRCVNVSHYWKHSNTNSRHAVCYQRSNNVNRNRFNTLLVRNDWKKSFSKLIIMLTVSR